jgi:hypothetical protein
LHLKVAIIGTAEELGLVPYLFGRPQAYAEFLDREISFNQPQPLLVVMPGGFGLAKAGPATALSGVAVDRSRRSYGLTRSAVLAVIALVRARGYDVAAPTIPPYTATANGPPVLLVFGLPVALVALAALFALRRARSGGVDERRK